MGFLVCLVLLLFLKFLLFQVNGVILHLQGVSKTYRFWQTTIPKKREGGKGNQTNHAQKLSKMIKVAVRIYSLQA